MIALLPCLTSLQRGSASRAALNSVSDVSFSGVWLEAARASPVNSFSGVLWTSGSCRLLLRTAGHQKISEASKTHTRRLIKARPPSRPPALNEERVRTLDSVILNGTPETPGRISGHWNRSVWTPDRPPPAGQIGAIGPDSGLRNAPPKSNRRNASALLTPESNRPPGVKSRAMSGTPDSGLWRLPWQL